MSAIAANLQAVRARIAAAEREYGRLAGSVQLLAVSKTWPASAVRDAALAGQQAFGENYVQEGVDKLQALQAEGLNSLEWHFIGPLQSNKTRSVAENFHWVHSVERLKIAERLSEQRDPQLPALQICLQVNVSGEESKSGVAPEELPALAEAVLKLPRLQLRGLMCIPEPTEDLPLLRSRFAMLRNLRDSINAQLNLQMDTLSMGMSHDVEAAVAEGATMVRVGTAIFGSRATA